MSDSCLSPAWLIVGLVIAEAGWIAQQAPAAGCRDPGKPVQAATGKTTITSQAGKAKPIRNDRYGDPLPPGARLRLGTARLQHGKGIEAAALSPDGKVLVTGGRDALRVWDTATCRLLRSHEGEWIPQGYQQGLSYLTISPDGRTLACGSEDTTVHFWDLTTGRSLQSLHTGAPGRQLPVWPGPWFANRIPDDAALRSLSYSPDGKRLATGPCNGPARVWDLASNKEVLRLPGQSTLVLFAPDGRSLAVFGDDGTKVALVSAEDGHRLRQVDHGADIQRIAFSLDGSLLATAGVDRTVRVWETATGRRQNAFAHRLEPGPNVSDWITAVAIAPDGKLLASGTTDGVTHLWDLDSGQERRALRGHWSFVTGLLFAPSGQTLYSVSWDSTVKRWDVASGEQRPAVPDVLEYQSVALSPDGRLLACGAETGGVIQLAETATGRTLRLLRDHRGRVSALAFSPDGKLLASGGQDGQIRLWEVASGQRLRTLGEPAPDLRAYIPSLTFAAEGRTLVTLRDGRVQLWTVATGKWVGQLKEANAVCMARAPDGQIIGVSGRANDIGLWDASTGQQLRRLVTSHRDFVFNLAFSADSRTLASGSDGDSIGLSCVANGAELRSWQAGQVDPHVLAFTPDDLGLLSGGDNGSLRLWDPATGKELKCWPGHKGGIMGLACAPDGRTVATSSNDHTVLVWDLRPAPRKLPAGGAAALWDDLGQGGQPAYRAGWTLADHPSEALLLLQDRLRLAVSVVDPKQVERWLADLDSDKFTIRQTSAKELARRAGAIDPQLRKALAETGSAEVRHQLEALLEHADSADSPPGFRRDHRDYRAVQVLERIGSPEAKLLLRRLADAAPTAPLAQAAQAALRRLGTNTR